MRLGTCWHPAEPVRQLRQRAAFVCACRALRRKAKRGGTQRMSTARWSREGVRACALGAAAARSATCGWPRTFSKLCRPLMSKEPGTPAPPIVGVRPAGRCSSLLWAAAYERRTRTRQHGAPGTLKPGSARRRARRQPSSERAGFTKVTPQCRPTPDIGCASARRAYGVAGRAWQVAVARARRAARARPNHIDSSREQSAANRLRCSSAAVRWY